MQDFRHIKAWQRGHALAIAINKASRHFTRAGQGHLRSQLVRASDAMPSNIVEGCGADSKKDFAKFLDVSIKSANETEDRLLTARDLDLISHADWQRLSAETIEVRKMTHGYRKKVLADASRGR
jgi:four helix bundle protein